MKLHDVVTPLLNFNLITYFQLLTITSTKKKQQIIYFSWKGYEIDQEWKNR